LTELLISIDDRDRIDLAEAARAGRTAHDLHRRGGGFGIADTLI